jgi:hypothetical protein
MIQSGINTQEVKNCGVCNYWALKVITDGRRNGNACTENISYSFDSFEAFLIFSISHCIVCNCDTESAILNVTKLPDVT